MTINGNNLHNLSTIQQQHSARLKQPYEGHFDPAKQKFYKLIYSSINNLAIIPYHLRYQQSFYIFLQYMLLKNHLISTFLLSQQISSSHARLIDISWYIRNRNWKLCTFNSLFTFSSTINP